MYCVKYLRTNDAAYQRSFRLTHLSTALLELAGDELVAHLR